jgi:hypothetical protein
MSQMHENGQHFLLVVRQMKKKNKLIFWELSQNNFEGNFPKFLLKQPEKIISLMQKITK